MRKVNLRWCVVALCAVAILFCPGCFTKTVYVPDGKAVRLRQDITADVWVLDAKNQPVAGKMVLKNGWWVLPDPEPVAKTEK